MRIKIWLTIIGYHWLRMKGELKKINGEWMVEYVTTSYSGGSPKRLGGYTKKSEQKKLVFTPDGQRYLNFFSNYKDGDRVDFKQVMVNPMGREVDPNDLGQNHSGCVWYAKLINNDKEEQRQHIIEIMNGDEELGLYDESQEIKVDDVFNDKKREGIKRVIHQHKVLQGLSLINPLHLQMTDNGHGEFPDGYKLTEKGIQYIIEQLNKEQDGK
jgi:hypothetical protein